MRRTAFLGSRWNVVGAAAGLALAVLMLAGVGSAQAEILQISATGFVSHCPCNGGGGDGAGAAAQEDNGVLLTTQNQTRFFAPVVFPADRQYVCSFSLVYHDINQNDAITARLLRKRAIVGEDPFASPNTMAIVRSGAPISNTIRKATTNNIAGNRIQAASFFYYVEVDSPTVNLNILGVQLDVKSACN
jgi:hypothetical protein